VNSKVKNSYQTEPDSVQELDNDLLLRCPDKLNKCHQVRLTSRYV